MKIRFSLLNWSFLRKIAEIMTGGASKHTDMENGTVDIEKYQDKLGRHMASYMAGEIDSETGESHLVHLAANAMILWDAENGVKNERPKLTIGE